MTIKYEIWPPPKVTRPVLVNQLHTLVAGRTLIADKEDWCRGSTARDRFGEPCHADSPRATQWCALGVISAVIDSNFLIAFNALEDAAQDLFHTRGLAGINDQKEYGHDAVIKIYDHAIATMERKLYP